MTVQAATPYFILNGKADQAIEFYRRALGANVEALNRFGDMDQSCSEAQKNRVMHAALRVGKALIMMSDGSGEGPITSGTVSVALALDDADEARRLFDALGATGKVIEPLFDSPWGSLFGVVHDAFGISWMFDCTKKQP